MIKFQSSPWLSPTPSERWSRHRRPSPIARECCTSPAQAVKYHTKDKYKIQDILTLISRYKNTKVHLDICFSSPFWGRQRRRLLPPSPRPIAAMLTGNFLLGFQFQDFNTPRVYLMVAKRMMVVLNEYVWKATWLLVPVDSCGFWSVWD